MADVAVISVITSGAVGGLGAISGFYAQRVALRTEEGKRLEARRSDLRDVLADAAKTAMGWKITDAKTMGELALHVAVEQARLVNSAAELGIRVGPEARVYIALKSVDAALLNVINGLRDFPEDMSIQSFTDRLWVPDDSDKQAREKLPPLWVAAESDIRTFLAAAAAVVGEPRLNA